MRPMSRISVDESLILAVIKACHLGFSQLGPAGDAACVGLESVHKMMESLDDLKGIRSGDRVIQSQSDREGVVTDITWLGYWNVNVKMDDGSLLVSSPGRLEPASEKA